jgi:hypothetical protein
MAGVPLKCASSIAPTRQPSPLLPSPIFPAPFTQQTARSGRTAGQKPNRWLPANGRGAGVVMISGDDCLPVERIGAHDFAFEIPWRLDSDRRSDRVRSLNRPRQGRRRLGARRHWRRFCGDRRYQRGGHVRREGADRRPRPNRPFSIAGVSSPLKPPSSAVTPCPSANPSHAMNKMD